MRSPRLYYGQPIDRSHPLMRGIVSRWKVVPWYSSGPRFIDLAGRNHGTLTNGPTWSGLGGKQCIKFDATDDRIPTANLSLVSFTVAAWVYPLSTGTTRAIVGQNNSGLSQVTFYLRVNSTSGFTVGGSFNEIGSLAPAANVWSFITMTYNGTTLTTHINAVQHATAAKSGTPDAASGSPATIGRLGDFNGQYWDGGISDVMIFNRGFSDSEVRSLYNATRQQYDPTLSWLRRRSYAFAAGGGGGFKPYWALRRAQVIGGGNH